MAQERERQDAAAREREVVDRARANTPLMDLYGRSLTSLKRGDAAVAWGLLQTEATVAEAQERDGATAP
jgi:hypothetical protein